MMSVTFHDISHGRFANSLQFFGFSLDISSSFIQFAITRRCAYVSSIFCGRKKIYPELENTGETHSRSLNLFA